MEHEQQIEEIQYKLVHNFLCDITARSSVPPATPRSRIIVLDTETTGLRMTDEILQISIIDDNSNILVNTLVHPYYHSTWPDAEKIHGITPDMVANAPYPHELLSSLKTIFYHASLIVGYNVYYDLRYFWNWGINPGPKADIMDVMREFADYYHGYGDPCDQSRYHSLTFCADYFGYTWPGSAHNSLHDAMATLHCYKKLIVN